MNAGEVLWKLLLLLSQLVALLPGLLLPTARHDRSIFSHAENDDGVVGVVLEPRRHVSEIDREPHRLQRSELVGLQLVPPFRPDLLCLILEPPRHFFSYSFVPLLD